MPGADDGLDRDRVGSGSDEPPDRAPADALELATFAVDLSLRRLDYDRGAIDEIRSRTGTLIAAASLIASFLGPQALKAHGPAAFSTLGFATFVAVLLMCIAILFPRPSLNLAPRGYVNFNALWDEREEPAEWRRKFAYWVEVWSDGNTAVLTGLQRLYVYAALGLVIEVGAFALRIALG